LLKRKSSLEVLALKLQLRPNHQKNLQAVSQVQVAVQRFQFHHKLLLERKSNFEISELEFYLRLTHLICSQGVSTDPVVILRLTSPRLAWRKRRGNSPMTSKYCQAISSGRQSVLPFPSPLLRVCQFGRRSLYFWLADPVTISFSYLSYVSRFKSRPPVAILRGGMRHHGRSQGFL
jgi:hypothetical protein